MLEVGALDAKKTLTCLLNRVVAEEEMLSLVASSGSAGRREATAAAKQIGARAAKLKIKMTWAVLKRDRDAGRP